MSIGGPLNAGFLANRNRFNYGNDMPEEMLEKRKQINKILKKYRVDLSTLALQYCAAHPTGAAVIPGASNAAQVVANAQSMHLKIPTDLINELRAENLLNEQVPV